MREARDIELEPVASRLGGLDLVVISANDPEAMLRHTEECRSRGYPFLADPGQQIAWMDGAGIRQLIDGATYLFTNEYEAALAEQKTGWTAEEILDRVGTRVITLGAKGARIDRKDEPTMHVECTPEERKVDPTGVGDGFRAGFLAGLAWGLPLERCAQVGSLLATYVIETKGTQEYELGQQRFLDRFEAAYGPAAVGRRRAARAVPAPLSPLAAARRSSRRRRRYAVRRRGRGRAGEELLGVGADLEPGTVLAAYRAGLFPMPVSRRGAVGWWSPDPRGVLPLDGAAGQPVAAGRLPALRDPGRHGVRRGGARPAPTRSGRAAGSARTSWRPTAGCTTSAGCTASRPGRSGRTAGTGWPAGCTASRSAACSRGSRCSTGSATRRRSALVGLVELLRADGRDRLLDVQWATEHLVVAGRRRGGPAGVPRAARRGPAPPSPDDGSGVGFCPRRRTPGMASGTTTSKGQRWVRPAPPEHGVQAEPSRSPPCSS